jgi:hypothetical protein
MSIPKSLAHLSDDAVMHRLTELVSQSRRAESDLVAHLAEVDRRRLFAKVAVPSLFAYCTEVLHFSEAEAYLRIAAARASREHPALLAMLADGRLHLTGVAKLAPHLTPANRDELLAKATHRSKRQIEILIAALAPRPDAPTLVRSLPTGPRHQPATPIATPAAGGLVKAAPNEAGPFKADATVAPNPPRAAIDGPGDGQLRPDAVGASWVPVSRPAPQAEPLAPGRYRIQFTASEGLWSKLQRLRGHLRHRVPDGDLAGVIEAAVSEKLEQIEARKYGTTRAPRQLVADASFEARSRHIPAAVRRAVSARDGGRCRFVDESGRRCSERERLEYHHRRPFGMGGDHSPGNLSLLCRAHNASLAAHDYGGGHAMGGAPSGGRAASDGRARIGRQAGEVFRPRRGSG